MHRFAEALFQQLLRTFPPERAYARVDFERAPMPTLVAHFLVQTLQRRFELEMEQLRTVRSPWFDYDHPAVQEAYGRLAEALREHARIPQAEWERTLRQAVHRVTSYLVHPTGTLIAFVFNDEEGPLPAHIVYRRLGYFAAYPYLRAAVEAYFERKGAVDITRTRFAELLHRVDQQMTSDYNADQWLTLLEPLLRMTGRRTPDGLEVPVEVLQPFFEEKGAAAIAARLEALVREGVEHVDEATLHRLIASEAKQKAAGPEPPPAPGPAGTAGAKEPAPGDEEVVPLWKRFMPAPEGTPAPGAGPPPGTPDPEAVPLWMRFRTNLDAGGADLTAIEKAILGEDAHLERERFINHLFSGSAEAYEQVLRRLYAAPTWTQASQIIARDVFKAHQVNIYSPPAIAFTNAVEARYRGGERD